MEGIKSRRQTGQLKMFTSWKHDLGMESNAKYKSTILITAVQCCLNFKLMITLGKIKLVMQYFKAKTQLFQRYSVVSKHWLYSQQAEERQNSFWKLQNCSAIRPPYAITSILTKYFVPLCLCSADKTSLIASRSVHIGSYLSNKRDKQSA